MKSNVDTLIDGSFDPLLSLNVKTLIISKEILSKMSFENRHHPKLALNLSTRVTKVLKKFVICFRKNQSGKKNCKKAHCMLFYIFFIHWWTKLNANSRFSLSKMPVFNVFFDTIYFNFKENFTGKKFQEKIIRVTIYNCVNIWFQRLTNVI